jgi:tetraacyldisaccharide 4'-kinase
LLQFLYSQFVRSRRRRFERRPDLRRRLGAPVISVGNLTVGGSGKTPLVGEIARLLIGMGERPSILSRGYGRAEPTDGVVVVSDGRDTLTDVAHAGDEPYMLARAVPRAVVVVNASRYLAGRVAEARFGCTVHLLDDGFQHLGLMREVDLLVAPPADFQHTRTLPFGRFREPLDAAAAADALLVPTGDLGDGAARDRMAARLGVRQAFSFTRTVDPPADSCSVLAFAGIAKPEDFFAELERAGWQLAGRRAFSDHHIYSPQELDALQREAQKLGASLVTTSKDFVKIDLNRGTERDPGSLFRAIPEKGSRIPFRALEIPLRISIEPAFRAWLQDRLATARAERGGGAPATKDA